MSIRKILFLAVAGIMISPALMAADIAAPDMRTFSDEFLGTHSDTDTIAGAGLTVTLGTEYTLGDIITLDFSGAALDVATVPTSVTSIPGHVVLGLLSADTGQAIYRVTSTEPRIVAEGAPVLTFQAADATDDMIMFNARDVQAAGGVTVSYSAATSTGIALDTVGESDVAYITVEEEYSIEMVEAFDAIIDVKAERMAFVEVTENVKFDMSSLTVDENDDAFADAYGTTLVGVDLVWSGNFGWIIDTDDSMDDVQPSANVVTVTTGTDGMMACNSVVVTAVTIAATCMTPEGSINLKLDPSMNKDADDSLAILPGTSFTVAVTVNYTGGDGDTAGSRLFSQVLGSWTLNGFQAFLPYMPYGSNITQIIYLVNRGSQSGALIVDWIDQNGNSESLGTVATIGPKTTMSLGPIINAALPMAQRTSGRLGLTITANVPAAHVQINAQYNVGGNRAFVLHEDNRP